MQMQFCFLLDRAADKQNQNGAESLSSRDMQCEAISEQDITGKHSNQESFKKKFILVTVIQRGAWDGRVQMNGATALRL